MISEILMELMKNKEMNEYKHLAVRLEGEGEGGRGAFAVPPRSDLLGTPTFQRKKM